MKRRRYTPRTIVVQPIIADRRPFREQAEIVLDQMKRCLEGAGSPARIFLCVGAFPGSFDLEVDCIAVI